MRMQMMTEISKWMVMRMEMAKERWTGMCVTSIFCALSVPS